MSPPAPFFSSTLVASLGQTWCDCHGVPGKLSPGAASSSGVPGWQAAISLSQPLVPQKLVLPTGKTVPRYPLSLLSPSAGPAATKRLATQRAHRSSHRPPELQQYPPRSNSSSAKGLRQALPLSLQAPSLALTNTRVLPPASYFCDGCRTSQLRPSAAGRPGTTSALFSAAQGVGLLTRIPLVSRHVIPRTETVFVGACPDPRGDSSGVSGRHHQSPGQGPYLVGGPSDLE